MSETFQRELAELESIRGIRIDKCELDDGSIDATLTIVTVKHTSHFSKPEPWRLGRVDWVYLYGLGCWALHWMVR